MEMAAKVWTVVGAAFLLSVVATFASAAAGDEIGRSEYKEMVEPICKRDTKANERILAGVRQEVRQGKTKTAAAKFAKASNALKQALHQLEAVPRPAADEVRLTAWFRYLKVEADLFGAAGKKLKAGDKAAAEHIVVKLTQNANKANVQVLPFGFRYCRLEPSRFT
jgi:hypothetical protein